MEFNTAVDNYVRNRSKENLARQVDALVAEMTEKEKIHMLFVLISIAKGTSEYCAILKIMKAGWRRYCMN